MNYQVQADVGLCGTYQEKQKWPVVTFTAATSLEEAAVNAFTSDRQMALFLAPKEFMSMNVQPEGTKAAYNSGSGKKEIQTDRTNRMVQFELSRFKIH